MKNKFQNIANSIGFTGTEAAVILFLCLMFFTGLVYRYYNLKGESVQRQYDYSAIDSLFYAAADSQDNDLIQSHKRAAGINTPGKGNQITPAAGRVSAFTSSELLEDNTEKNFRRIRKIKPGEAAVNINTATKEELMSLPGVGEKTAGKIIELRLRKKGFSSIDELLEVKGIGKARLERLKNLIRTD